MAKYIKAPFNFVPLNGEVLFNDYPDDVSQVIPFKDGESGSLKIKLTALTPVFIRNGYAAGDTYKPDSFEFSHMEIELSEKKYFIPGTSLKGMFRNVFEIMTHGYIRIDKRMKFAIRDWDNKELYPLKEPKIQTAIRCGWLEINEFGSSIIHNHGYPLRINHLRLDEFFKSKEIKVSFKERFSKDNNPDLTQEQKINGKKYDPKQAVFKYALLGDNIRHIEKVRFKRDDRFYCLVQNRQMTPPAFTERRVEYDPAGTIEGTIVFTGQPDPWINPDSRERKMSAGKFYEFIFPNKKIDEYELSKDDIHHFKFIYQDSDSWQYFKSKGRIPVFFRTQRINGKDVLKDFGLALLYKLPYERSAIEVAASNQNMGESGQEFDLADKIFGLVKQSGKPSKTSNTSGAYSPIKGRVQFRHAFMTSGSPLEDTIIKRMGSPKASYLPFYIDQAQFGRNGKTNKYLSYNDEQARLSGWKRYPIHYGANISNPTDEYNPKLDTKFVPLKKDSTFEFCINMHNLKPYEIGGLISAITFHNNHDKLAHSLGFGKSYGFGKIKVEILESTLYQDIENYLVEFENKMDELLKPVKWIDQPRLQELFSMAWNRNEIRDDLMLNYMEMSNDREGNHFYQAKKLYEYLEKYSLLTKKPFKATSLNAEFVKQKEIADKLAKEEREKAEIKKLEEKKRLENENRQKEIEQSRKKKVESGLSILEKHCDLNRCKKEVDHYIKLSVGQILPTDQDDYLFAFLKKYNDQAKPRDRKDFNLPFEESHIWKKITSWVGEGRAKEWYEKIKE